MDFREGAKGVSHGLLTFLSGQGLNSPMPKQIGIEFPGAMYHVMARRDRREAIVRDDKDRRTFVRTLGQACERAGFRVQGGC
jgi:hypothetical protein